jgi:hypothetical protein
LNAIDASGIPCEFQERVRNPAHAAADEVSARDARTLFRWQGYSASAAVGGGTLIRVVRNKEVQLAVCLTASICNAKDAIDLVKRIEEIADVARDLKRRDVGGRHIQERRAPSSQEPPSPGLRIESSSVVPKGGAEAPGGLGSIRGFQGVFRVDGRLDSKRLAKELKG